MTAFSRAVLPLGWSMPQAAQALLSLGLSGKLQARTPLLVGRTWEEVYPPLQMTSAVERGWFAQVQQFFQSGASFTIAHRAFLKAFGAGGGTPLINGAGQTGSTVVTDGWPNNTKVLVAGDLVKLGALNLVYDVTADVTSNGSGQATIPIAPMLVVGNSPADNSAVTYGANVTFTAVLIGLDAGLNGRGDEYVDGLRLTFLEMP